MIDYHSILDLLPALSRLYYQAEFPDDVRLSGVQETVLLAIGLQHKTLEQIEAELNLSASQILSIFMKTVKKLTSTMQESRSATQAEEVEVEQPALVPAGLVVSLKRNGPDAEGTLSKEDTAIKGQRKKQKKH